MTFAFGSLSLPNIRLQKPSDSTEENSETKKSGRPKKEKPLDPERVMKVGRVVFSTQSYGYLNRFIGKGEGG